MSEVVVGLVAFYAGIGVGLWLGLVANQQRPTPHPLAVVVCLVIGPPLLVYGAILRLTLSVRGVL